jgi:chromosome segregation ATPase
MTDAVVEKLVQKVANMLDEMSDLNIQVRRLTPTQETLNRTNERIDAILGAIKQIERGISSDEKKIAELEKQTKSVEERLLDVKQHAVAAGSSSESRFNQLENKLEEWFGEHKVALIALAVAQVIFFIVVLLR